MEGENGPSEKSMWARRKFSECETHFYHILLDAIITECIERGVGTLAVSSRAAAGVGLGENWKQEVAYVGVRPSQPVPRVQRRGSGCRGIEEERVGNFQNVFTVWRQHEVES
jgi:hypothetical protein